MAKYASLSEDGRPTDGQFEVITLPHTAKWRVLGVSIKAATRGLGPQPTATHYCFHHAELLTLDADTAVSVDIVPRALATVS